MKTKSNEQGATLIVVLIMMILISVVGLYALRHSLLSLKLATNAQVQTLLMQTSDVALDHFTKHFNSNEATNFAATPIGQVLLDGNQGKELQFCFKPSEVGSTANNFFNLRDFRIIERQSVTSKLASTTADSGNINAVCNPETMFSVGRKVTVTQVSVVNPDDPSVESKRFEYTTKDTDYKGSNTGIKRVRVVVTTLAPAWASSASIDDMNACLQTRMMDDLLLKNKADSTVSPVQVKVETVDECLNSIGVPFNTQVAEFIVNLNETRK